MQELLWFDQYIWLVIAIPFVGLIAAGFSKRREPSIQGDKVLRHDVPARLSHWTHALGTTGLLVSGIILGTRFTPSFVNVGETPIWLNMHFLFSLLFLFGTFYWLGNTLISRYRFREHLPTKNAITYTKRHYGHLLGIKKFEMPEEEKYFESERMAFVLALVAAVFVGVSGLVKVLAHLIFLSEALVNVTTWIHDISAAAMLFFFVAHVFFAAIAPFSWKALRSMFTGYLPLDYAENDHAGWLKALQGEQHERTGEKQLSQKTESKN